MDAQTLQLQEELSSDAEAVAIKLEALRQATDKGDLNTPKTRAVMARAFNMVHAALAVELGEEGPAPRGRYRNWLKAVPSDVAAAIALREVLSTCLQRRNSVVTLQELTTRIGRLYETEVRIREASTVNPLYMQKVLKRFEDARTRNPRHIRAAVNAAYKEIMKGEINSTLTNMEAANLGKFGVQACMDAGIIYQVRTVGSKGVLVYYELESQILDYLTSYNHEDTRYVVDHGSTAMICEPEPWESLGGGGYLSLRRKALFPLLHMRKFRPEARRQLGSEYTADKMPQVFQCANYLQSIPYTLHQPTVAAIRRVWEEGGGVLGVPFKNAPQRPKFPFPEDFVVADASPEDKEVVRLWKQDMAEFYDSLRRWQGRVREVGSFLRNLKDPGGALWFPTYLDSRGRWYYRGIPNIQGSDLSKSVLFFHEKRALGHEGVFWLKVHIANCFGFDKVRLKARAAWVDENWGLLERALDEPENHPEVWGTDSPWCMYAACWELREAYRSGNPATYETGIVVHQDASCSGLQHFSALLADEQGAGCVNLIDLGGSTKADIYSAVAAATLALIEQDLGKADDQYARYWLDVGIPRGLAKKPCMTYVYGATLLGTAHFAEQYVRTEMPDKLPVDVAMPAKYFVYVARKLFEGIAKAVPAAAAMMNWLQDITRKVPRGTRMVWTTPSGFKVQHDYRGFDEKRVQIKSCGILWMRIREWNEDTVPSQMRNAISPNFVHALDATHMTFVANRCNEEGLQLAAIHDSFGTHPRDVGAMRKIVQEEFVRLYSDKDIIPRFLQEVGVETDLPPRGDLDINNVLNSEFFVS